MKFRVMRTCSKTGNKYLVKSFTEKGAANDFIQTMKEKGKNYFMEDTEVNFKSFLEASEEKEMDKLLSEDAVSVISQILGYSMAGLAGAFGGTLLILGGVKALKGLKSLWDKIFKTGKEVFDPNVIVKEIKTDARVNQVKNKSEETKRKFEEELKYVYLNIANKDFDQAKNEYNKLDASLRNSPDVYKSIITEITRSMQLPPIYVQSPGNKTYQAIKKVINIKVARAAAAATDMAFRQAVGETEVEENE